ncbi:L,D-transpeptidase family protein, partial [Enterobacter hormaechei]
GIGLRVSQGCIRLRNNDIKYLFDNVSVGTRVQLIDQPLKVTTEPDGSRWVEVHEPLSRNRAEFESTNKVPLPISAAQRTQLISEGAGAELERRSGMPVKLAMPGGAALTGPTGP